MATKSTRDKVGKLPDSPWWEKQDSQIAGALYSWALGVEYFTYKRRVRNMTLYRLTTGEEPPLSMGLWMSKRVAQTVTTFGSNYLHPHRNVIRNACDVLENRIGTIRPFIEISPNDVSFKIRDACKDETDLIDTVFDEKKVYGTTRMCFRDAFMWGMCFVYVDANDEGDDVVIQRIPVDDIIIDEVAAAVTAPSCMGMRRFISRNDAWGTWGGISREIDAAIRNAPAAIVSSGVAGASMAHDMICPIQAWKLPSAGGPGMRVLTLGNALIAKTPYTRKRFPFAIGRWQPQTMGYFSVGCAYDMSPAQMEINIKWEHIRACERAMAWPGWLVAKGSTVGPKSLGGRPAANWEFMGQEPKPIVPQAVRPEMYECAKEWENFAYSIAGLTQQQAQGQKQPGITAGVAIRLMVSVEDTRNKSRQIMGEDLIQQIGDLTLDVADEVNLTVTTSGSKSRKLTYAELGIKRDKRRVKAFPVNALSGDPGADQQTISEWYADGLIDMRAYFRLQNMPDRASYASLATASDDLVEQTLDEMVSTGKFVPPSTTYDNVQGALKHAQARYNLELRFKSPPKVMRALRQFMSVLSDMIAHPDGQTLQPPQPLAAAPGLIHGSPVNVGDPTGLGPAGGIPSAPGNVLPAAPPIQVAPSMAAPQQLAA